MEENSKIHDIRKVSDYVNDVLEKTPSWILIWGNTFFVCFIGVLFLLAWFIKYPDVINAEVEITSVPPPTGIVSKVTGLIDSVAVSDKEYVKKGEILLRLSSFASPEKVQEVKVQVNKLNLINDAPDFISFRLPEISDLGTLSDTYYSLYREFEDFKTFLKQNSVFISMGSYQRQINEIKRLNESLSKQETIFSSSFELTEKNLSRNANLNSEGLISDIELERIQGEHLLQKRQLEEFRTREIENIIQIEQLKTTINELKSTRWEGYSTRLHSLKNSLSLIQEELSIWEDNYLIKSPIDGQVSMLPQITYGKNINPNDNILYIIPYNEAGGLRVYLTMPQTNSSEIGVGSDVQIRLDAYPYDEYGVIETVVSDIGLLNETIRGTSYISLTCHIPELIITSHGDTIPFTQGMTGIGLVIKKDKRLLGRFFDKLNNK